MRESDIMHETPQGYWVAREPRAYTVYRPSPSGTHSVSDSSYPRDADSLSIAIARCDYLARRAIK
jgi:hypothetical protein